MACKIYAVGRNTSKIFLVNLDYEGGVGWISSFADNEDRSSSAGNTNPIFTVGASDEVVFAARNGTDEVKTNAHPEAVDFYRVNVIEPDNEVQHVT